MQASQVAVRIPESTVRGATRQADAWSTSIDRGPDWLFIRLEPPRGRGDAGAVERLEDHLWQTIREHGAHRVVLELDLLLAIDDDLIAMMAALGVRVRDDGGLLRVCGLERANLDRLRRSAHAPDLPHFASRSEAVIARGSVGG